MTDERILVGFDFAFGYPRGFAKQLGVKNWVGVWDQIADNITDSPDNKSNRFEVGAAFNRRLNIDPPPFWGHPWQHTGRYAGLGPTRPTYPELSERRLCEVGQTGTQPVWKLAYAGSVGSQTLLGIAALQRLRLEPEFKDHIAIWPFETQFADKLSKPIIFAEIYPSQHSVDLQGFAVKDAAQVAAVVRDFKYWDNNDTLHRKLSAPDLRGTDRATVLREEGWIVGR